ncbi:MAG: RNA methyltransferase [Candidatus Odinarchaeota archaeon]
MSKIFLLLPSSLLEDCSDIDSKTIKVGLIARAAAVFKISKIIVYNTGEKWSRLNAKFLKTIFDYIDCPQYLRKYFFPLNDDLRSVGRLPPLEAPHHMRFVKSSEIQQECIRQGVVVRKNNSRSYVHAGLDKLIPIYDANIRLKEKVNIKILRDEGGELYGVIVGEPEYYWGYKTVIFNEPLPTVLEKLAPEIVLGTSKYGENINNIISNLKHALENKKTIAIAFGSPKKGLFEIIEDKKLVKELFDYMINFIPGQGTRTVRTEEAVYASLSIINLIIGNKI